MGSHLGGMDMRVGVCGIACERCPRMARGACPSGPRGCQPRENQFCALATCAHGRGLRLCFECPDFPCETTRLGPVSFGYCQYLSGKD